METYVLTAVVAMRGIIHYILIVILLITLLTKHFRGYLTSVFYSFFRGILQVFLISNKARVHRIKQTQIVMWPSFKTQKSVRSKLKFQIYKIIFIIMN